MRFWPQTPRTLLARLADLSAGEDEAEWARFTELYDPAVRRFVQLRSPDMPEADVDDLVQDVFLRLVPVLRQGLFDPRRAKFSTYLSAVVTRLLIDRARRAAVRGEGRNLELDAQSEGDPGYFELESSAPDAATLADLNWRMARHQAAVAHVFAKSAIGEQARRIWLMSEADGLSAKEIGAKLGLAANSVRAIRSRVAKMVAAVEAQFD